MKKRDKLNKVRVPKDLFSHIPEFLKRREEELARLKIWLEEGNFNEIGAIAHQIKGFAAGFGFVGLGDIAKNMYFACKSENLKKVSTHILEMDIYLSNLEVEQDYE